MIFDVRNVPQLLSKFGASMRILQHRFAEIVVSRWNEYSHQPQSTSKDLGSIQPTRGINDISMGNPVSSLQSYESNSTHYWERTLL